MIIKDNKDNKVYEVEEDTQEEEFDRSKYEKDMENLEFYKKKFEESKSEAEESEDKSNQTDSIRSKPEGKPRARIDDLLDGESNVMSVFAWVAFGIGLIPFFPYKTIISLVGVLLGYLHYSNHKGSKAPMIGNIIILALRAIIWMLILLSFPLLTWWSMLRF